LKHALEERFGKIMVNEKQKNEERVKQVRTGPDRAC
jgi:hypothetical protein